MPGQSLDELRGGNPKCAYCGDRHDMRTACPEYAKFVEAQRGANPDEPFNVRMNRQMCMVRLLGGPFAGETFERPKGEPHFKVTRQYSPFDGNFSYEAFTGNATEAVLGQELYFVKPFEVEGHTIYFGLHHACDLLEEVNAMWKSHIWAIHGEGD